MTVEFRKWITRAMLRAERPGTLFVFGDNMIQKGLGGQAKEMRGEPNAVGLPTKHFPTNSEEAFFSDDDFEHVKHRIDGCFERLKKHLKNGGTVVWPSDGVGSGLADLANRAPKIQAYIDKQREFLLYSSE